MGAISSRSIVRTGLLAGAGSLYAALVGLYTKFADLALVESRSRLAGC